MCWTNYAHIPGVLTNILKCLYVSMFVPGSTEHNTNNPALHFMDKVSIINVRFLHSELLNRVESGSKEKI